MNDKKMRQLVCVLIASSIDIAQRYQHSVVKASQRLLEGKLETGAFGRELQAIGIESHIEKTIMENHKVIVRLFHYETESSVLAWDVLKGCLQIQTDYIKKKEGPSAIFHTSMEFRPLTVNDLLAMQKDNEARGGTTEYVGEPDQVKAEVVNDYSTLPPAIQEVIKGIKKAGGEITVVTV